MSTQLEETVKKLASVCGIEFTERLCNVDKVDSSFGAIDKPEIWEPPVWVKFRYYIVLHPVRRMLVKKSLHQIPRDHDI